MPYVHIEAVLFYIFLSAAALCLLVLLGLLFSPRLANSLGQEYERQIYGGLVLFVVLAALFYWVSFFSPPG